jgi:hypothetical protein
MKTASRKSNPMRLKFIYFLLGLASIAYIALTYKAELNHKSTSSPGIGTLLLSLSVAIPEIAIWVLAFVSSIRLKQYTMTIKKFKDGKSLRYVSDSLLLMSLYVVLLSASGSVVELFRYSHSLRAVVVLENYIPLSIALASSLLLCLGSIRLNRMVSIRFKIHTRLGIASVYVAIAALFARHFYVAEPKLVPQNGIPRFVLSDKLLFFSYILPHLIMWAVGIFGCVSMANYSLFTKGAIYKRLFNKLYQGILLVFICTFLAQLFIISDFNLNGMSLGLILVYLLLVLAACGFVLIYRGSESLGKLENV